MILIKDRHTTATAAIINTIPNMGNMILIKDRHKQSANHAMLYPSHGKYDTYKESTLSLTSHIRIIRIRGNMILIKDRHPHLFCLLHLTGIGKYDTYKG